MPRRIDHVVQCVADLDRAAASYRLLGFTLTPRAAHPWGRATTWRCSTGTSWSSSLSTIPARWRTRSPVDSASVRTTRRISRGERACRCWSLPARTPRQTFLIGQRPGWIRTSRSSSPVRHLCPAVARGWSASLAFVTHPEMPDAAFFSCHLHDPDVLWKPEYQSHVNGARRLTEVVMSAPGPGRYRDFFARLTFDEDVLDGETLEVGPPSDRIIVLSPARLVQRFPELPEPDASAPPRFQACRVTVSSLAASAAVLKRNDVPHQRTEGSIVIAPSDAFGVAIELAVG